MWNNPSDQQSKLVAEEMLNPIYLEQIELEKAAQELAKTNHLRSMAQKQAQKQASTQQQNEQYQPSRKKAKSHLNPGLHNLKNFTKKRERDTQNAEEEAEP